MALPLSVVAAILLGFILIRRIRGTSFEGQRGPKRELTVSFTIDRLRDQPVIQAGFLSHSIVLGQ
jgi:hypothetical protein